MICVGVGVSGKLIIISGTSAQLTPANDNNNNDDDCLWKIFFVI